MTKTIFESQTVDFDTGEVKSVTSVTKRTDHETFGFHRTTEGIDWIYDFTGREIQVMITLLQYENLKTGIISFGAVARDYILDRMGLSLSQFNKTLKTLIDKNSIIKLSITEFIVNPKFFYQGGTARWKAKYDFYQSHKKS